jgi:hypothetical protein
MTSLVNRVRTKCGALISTLRSQRPSDSPQNTNTGEASPEVSPITAQKPAEVEKIAAETAEEFQKEKSSADQAARRISR